MNTFIRTCIIVLFTVIVFLGGCKNVEGDVSSNMEEQNQNRSIILLGQNDIVLLDQDAKDKLAALPKGQKPLGTGCVLFMDSPETNQLYWFTDVEEEYDISVQLVEGFILIYHAAKPIDDYCYMSEYEFLIHIPYWTDNTLDGPPITIENCPASMSE